MIKLKNGVSVELKKLPVADMEPFIFTDLLECHCGWGKKKKNGWEERKEALLESIAAWGIIEPLLVVPQKEIYGMGLSNGHKEYQIIDGQARWECAKRLFISKVPCLILHGLLHGLGTDKAASLTFHLQVHHKFYGEVNAANMVLNFAKFLEKIRVIEEITEDDKERENKGKNLAQGTLL